MFDECHVAVKILYPLWRIRWAVIDDGINVALRMQFWCKTRVLSTLLP